MDRMDDPVANVLAWHAALNAGDIDHLVALSDDEVELGGPRGPARGVSALRGWAERSGIRLEPGRIFRRGDAVVVAQRATWRAVPDEEASPPVAVASRFVVRHGRVARVERYDDLAAALVAAGLGEGDEAARSGEDQSDVGEATQGGR